MKLKILIAPVSFIIAVIVFISFVWPEFGTMQQKQSEKDQHQKALEDTLAKKQNP